MEIVKQVVIIQVAIVTPPPPCLPQSKLLNGNLQNPDSTTSKKWSERLLEKREDPSSIPALDKCFSQLRHQELAWKMDPFRPNKSNVWDYSFFTNLIWKSTLSNLSEST